MLAVIDWEMSTIGDPLLDIGLAFGFWGNDRQ
jgi:aminoglycoside phosphotransferase (APT) family kinase protein